MSEDLRRADSVRSYSDLSVKGEREGLYPADSSAAQHRASYRQHFLFYYVGTIKRINASRHRVLVHIDQCRNLAHLLRQPKLSFFRRDGFPRLYKCRYKSAAFLIETQLQSSCYHIHRRVFRSRHLNSCS